MLNIRNQALLQFWGFCLSRCALGLGLLLLSQSGYSDQNRSPFTVRYTDRLTLGVQNNSDDIETMVDDLLYSEFFSMDSNRVQKVNVLIHTVPAPKIIGSCSNPSSWGDFRRFKTFTGPRGKNKTFECVMAALNGYSIKDPDDFLGLMQQSVSGMRSYVKKLLVIPYNAVLNSDRDAKSLNEMCPEDCSFESRQNIIISTTKNGCSVDLEINVICGDKREGLSWDIDVQAGMQN